MKKPVASTAYVSAFYVEESESGEKTETVFYRK